MKRYFLNVAFLVAIILSLAVVFPVNSSAQGTRSDAAEKELSAIANLLTGDSGIMAHDFSSVSGEFCMLEKGTKNNMIHFSGEPEKTTEDIVYFISPDELKGNGLQVKKLNKLPTELGKMEPLRWYYYDGKGKEPHHGKKLHRDFLVMAIDVK
ncbi:MAG: hypothetical protein IME98_00290 [Proteobacteria bacterium]|nr:hypothetical protein [Pseudomonadota bacterium]